METKSTLKRFDRCVGDIGNYNGYLTCQKSGDVPAGSYTNTCINPSVDGTTLTAICRNKRGHTHPTVLKNIDECRGDINNNDGTLACDRAGHVPPGSYTKTCIDIALSGQTLTAKCRDKVDYWIEAQLAEIDLCQGDITNIDGNLSCNKRGTVPAGSYQQSCTNPRLIGTTLTAMCALTTGRVNNATLEEVDRCIGDISNADGYLTCMKSGEVPRGSYLDSCYQASVSGTSLTAVCRGPGGREVRSTLRNIDRCVGDISNSRGVLTCPKN